MSRADEIAVVTGGTRWKDPIFVRENLDAFHARRPIREMICGMAEGVDMMAYHWCNLRGIPVREFPADWHEHEHRAGPIRNQEMIDENPDITVGLVFPGHRGTIDMTRRLRKAGIERVFFEPKTSIADWG
ncbi:moco carrier protein [Citromicrobium phage vB_CbaS-RXM]|nr:moco carrier protein [Citromicrobium phage vB_CbaS-RXM]